MSTQGTELRAVTQYHKAEDTAKVVNIPTPPISTIRTPAAAKTIGVGAATIAALAEKGSDIALNSIIQTMREDNHNGQLLFQQGKTIEELKEAGVSQATMAGFQSMKAAKLADDEYNAALLDIENGDKQMTPDQYTAKLQEKFKARMTGDALLDDYIGQLSANMDTKLVKAHTKAHTEWKINETVNSASNLLASKAGMLDNPEDKKLVMSVIDGPDSPLSTLSAENRKKAIIDAVVLSLGNEQDGLYKELGGLEGLAAKYNISSAERSAIQKSHQQFVTNQQNKFNADYERESFDVVKRVRAGALTYEQGVEMMSVLGERYGKGDRQLAQAETAVQGASMELIRKREADMRQAAEKAAKDEEFRNTVQLAMVTGNVWALNEKGKKAAFDSLSKSVMDEVNEGVQAGTIPQHEVVSAFSKRYATAVDKWGLVDPNMSDKLTANLNSASIVDSKGELSAVALTAYQQTAELYKKNRGLALQHLKSDQAKELFLAAWDYDVSNMDSEEALKRAVADTQNEDVKKRNKELISSKAGKEAVTAAVSDYINSSIPARLYGGTDRGGIVDSADVERAANDRAYRARIERRIASKMAQGSSLTVEQATKMVMDEMNQSQAYVLGHMVQPRNGQGIYSAMGLDEFTSETGVPNEALGEYLKANGKAMWGEAMWDTGGTVGGWAKKWWLDATRGIPRMDVSMVDEGGVQKFVVTPYRLDEAGLGKQVVIDAKEVGNWYKNWRKEHDSARQQLGTEWSAAHGN